MSRKDRATVDFYHAVTLAYDMFISFNEIAPKYGVRLEGIEDDANEHSDFWQQVARQMLSKSGTGAADPTAGEDGK